MSARPIPESRLPSIDGWRAVSIGLVVASHVSFTRGCPPGVAGVVSGLFDGALGVRLFFAISGFLITWLLLGEARTTGGVSLSGFWLRRMARIFPVYFAFLLVVLLLQLAGRCSEAGSSWLGSLTFSRNFIGRGDSVTIHLWSLAVEEQFYLLWPLAFVTLGLHARRRLAVVILSVVIACCIAVQFFAPEAPDGTVARRLLSHWSFFRQADALAVGCLAAVLAFPRRPTVNGYLVAGCAALLACSFARVSPLWAPGSAVAAVLSTMQVAAFAVLLLDSVTTQRTCYRILNLPVIRGLGLVSYSLYIWHMLFVDHFAPGIPGLFNHWSTWWAFAILTAIASFALIERPMQGLRRRLAAVPRV